MSARSFDFWFDFSSPYSYIAAERIDGIAERHGWTANWKPMLLGAIFKITGGQPLTDAHPWRAEYAKVDFVRSAQMHGLTLELPSRFPQPTVNAARAMIWLQRTDPAKARPFALEAFRTLFVRDGDLTDKDTLARIAAAVGADPGQMAAGIADDAIKQALVRNNEEAAAAKVFGAPTCIVEGERFWGNDRLDQLERRLAR